MYTPWALLASMIEPYHTQVLFSYVTNTVVAAFVIIRTVTRNPKEVYPPSL